jgi:RNA polymerase sigma-70 factor, ECF subfamily
MYTTSPATVPVGKFTEASLREHQSAMMRFAKRKVRDESLAEEAVQEAMLAAWQHADRFAGQSSLKTWMLGILNHKIQDMFRKESRYVSLTRSDGEDDDRQDYADHHPMAAAGWQLERDSGGPDSDDPLYVLIRSDMRRALVAEIEALPLNLKAVFERQVIDDQSTDMVCDSLGITPANAWVRLHRARKHLSSKLEHHLQ